MPVPASAPRAEDDESGGEDGETAEVSGRAKRVAKPPPYGEPVDGVFRSAPSALFPPQVNRLLAESFLERRQPSTSFMTKTAAAILPYYDAVLAAAGDGLALMRLNHLLAAKPELYFDTAPFIIPVQGVYTSLTSARAPQSYRLDPH